MPGTRSTVAGNARQVAMNAKVRNRVWPRIIGHSGRCWKFLNNSLLNWFNLQDHSPSFQHLLRTLHRSADCLRVQAQKVEGV